MTFKVKLRLVATAAMAMSLAACGGGGGGGAAPAADAPAAASPVTPIGSAPVAPVAPIVIAPVTPVTPVMPAAPVVSPATPGTLATANYAAGSERLAFLQTLNTFRQECGLPVLSQNTVLDTAAVVLQNFGGPAPQIKVAADAGYTMASNAGAVAGNYNSNSTNNTAIGTFQTYLSLMAPDGLINLMRPYSEIGVYYYRTQAGFVNQRNFSVMLGNVQALPAAASSPVTFPCAATTTIPPGNPAATGSVYVAGGAAGAIGPAGGIGAVLTGTPIAIFANFGSTLVLNSATVTGAGGSVALTLMDSGKSAGKLYFPSEGYVFPQSTLNANASYDVVINGTINGTPFVKSFTFKTGAAISVQLP